MPIRILEANPIMSKSVLVLGATSTIAEAVCRIYANEGAKLVLVGRQVERLESVAADLRVRGAGEVSVIAGDLEKIDPAKVIAESSARLGSLDVILLAYGILGDQRECEQDLAAAAQMIDTNFRSAALWALAAANELEKQHSGTLVVIGSVAGDRGRQSNYLYGATKGGLAVLVQGIAHRLAASGAHAVLVKPGFVDTAMTAHIGGKGPLWSSPDKVARLIRKAADSSKAIAYVPGYWRLIMTVIKSVPSAIFHRTKL
jgi:short-subunit dehydrogenase